VEEKQTFVANSNRWSYIFGIDRCSTVYEARVESPARTLVDACTVYTSPVSSRMIWYVIINSTLNDQQSHASMYVKKNMVKMPVDIV
jgi:hypothetical protein